MYSTWDSDRPLTSICSPVGADIPQSIKDRIIKGEYIDFDSLLEKDGVSNTPGDMSLKLNMSGQIVLHERKPNVKINSINSWSSAFLVFMAIYLRAHPNRNQELFKYMHIIRTAASRFSGWGWREYDRNFRMRMQAHPQKSWAVIDGELWALYVVVPASPQSSWGFNNEISQGEQNRFRGSNTKFGQNEGRLGSSTGGFCFAFNRGNCSKPQCHFRHVCDICNEEGHGSVSCKHSMKSNDYQ